MALREEFDRIGNWLFRWRSYLPLFLVGLFFLVLMHFGYPRHGHALDEGWAIFCMLISLAGLAVRMYAVGCVPRGTSGRNVKGQRAMALNTTGIYSLVRHPLYLGNFVIWFGIAMSLRSWWFVGITVLIFWLYYEKIMFAEEEFLRREYGEAFLEWARRTPTFFPRRLGNWQPPALPFQWKNALRREYSGLFAIISIYTVLEVIEEWRVNGRLALDIWWVWIFLCGLAVYLVLMFLKKKTNWLDVKGM